jgi:hypothetical protein
LTACSSLFCVMFLKQPYSWLHPLLWLPSSWLIVVLCLVSLRQPYSWLHPLLHLPSS